MAQLKDSLVTGSLRVTDTTYTNDLIINNTTAPTIATDDYLLLADASNSNKVLKGPVLNTSNTSVWLNQAGTWSAPTSTTVGLNNVTNDAQIPKSVFTEAYQLLYSTGSATYQTLTANKSTTKKFLTMTGASASAGAAPVWSTIAAGDLPIATSSTVGGVSVSTGLSVDANGAISLSNISAAADNDTIQLLGIKSSASNILLYNSYINMQKGILTVGTDATGNIWCGTATANTPGTDTRRMGVANGSGKLYLYAAAGTTATKGLCAYNTNLDPVAYIFQINQNNKISQLADIVCTINLLAGSISSVLSTTAGVEAYTTLTLGNSTATTSTGESTGKIVLYSSSAYSHTLIGASATENRIITLPDATGTVALTTSNITGTAANVTGTVAIANGGTGATSAGAARSAIEEGNYLTCSTGASTATKTVAYTGFVLKQGIIINVLFSNQNTAATTNITLNVNSTGELPIYCKGARITRLGLLANYIYRLMYDGQQWQVLNPPEPLFGESDTAAGTAAKVLSTSGSSSSTRHIPIPGFVEYEGATVYIKFTENNSAAGPTLNINRYGAKRIENHGSISSTARYAMEVNTYIKFRYHYDTETAVGTYILENNNLGIVTIPGVTAVEESTDPDTGETIPAVEQVHGLQTLYLGNNVTSTTNNGLTGRILLYNSKTVGIVMSAETSTTTASRTWYFPSTTGHRYFVGVTSSQNGASVGSYTQPVFLDYTTNNEYVFRPCNSAPVAVAAATAQYYLLGSTATSGNASSLYCKSTVYVTTDGYLYADRVYNAVWNDYAEYRQVDIDEPGYCVIETPTGIMKKSTERLQAGCKITSDTYGTCMGQTATAKTPIAVSGRVLVYPYRDRSEYPLGAAVCSAPNGTIDIMTREEIKEYPERIIGTVSEIPTYEVWNNKVQVNGLICIYIK